MTDDCSAASASATEISKCFGLRIESLTQIALPDQWYFAKGTTLAERFRATFNAMPAGPDKPSSVAELMARFDNHGEPMAHTVWLNQPLSCPQCNDAGADGFYTVLSVRNGVSVMITALEMHMALTHQGRFPDEKLALLHRVFAPVTVAH
ncbi:MAG TPA: hypothetical protein VN859_04955 [Steroidobacteraceae bacterium]|nr:hypothetical protein [Steroidobacteraceae bacterium]